MVAVLSSPLFANDFPLNTTNAYPTKAVHDAVADAIVGAAPGVLVTVNRARIASSTNAEAKDGGKRTIDSVSDINRITTVQDATNIENEVKRKNIAGLVFARDLSGNGGPEFTRT